MEMRHAVLLLWHSLSRRAPLADADGSAVLVYAVAMARKYELLVLPAPRPDSESRRGGVALRVARRCHGTTMVLVAAPCHVGADTRSDNPPLCVRRKKIFVPPPCPEYPVASLDDRRIPSCR